MKKFILLVMTVAIICNFSIVSFAANETPFSLTPAAATVELGDGTTDVDVTFSVNISEDVTLSMFSVQLIYDSENITVKSMDTSAMGAVMNFNTGYSDVNAGMLSFMNDDAVTVYDVKAGKYDIPMVLTVNNTAEATYDITFDSNTMLVGSDWSTPVNDLETYPTTTITVKEAEKVPTDEKVADLVADTTPIVSEDGKTQYNDVAVFVADFALADYADVEDYGVKFADKKESLKGVTGNGTLSWVFAFYGIGEGETPAVETFKTILK